MKLRLKKLRTFYIKSARNVEDDIQRVISYLLLGMHGVFLDVGFGKNYRNKYKLTRVHRVFRKYSD